MSDLKQVLSDEIRRLARKEIKLAVQPLQANIVSLRRQVAELKKLLKESNKKNEILQKKAGGENVAELTSEEPKLRLNAAGIIRIRTKLKLSQSDFAKLLDVTMHSVCSWENGKSHPRAAMKTKICSLRKLGRSDFCAFPSLIFFTILSASALSSFSNSSVEFFKELVLAIDF